MNALVRQMAVLSVLWAMCELLLPEGRHQPVVRMTASLLMIAALMTTIGGWLGSETPVETVMTWRIQRASEDTYQRTALAAMANQIETYCIHMAQRAGYAGSAAVYLTMDGAVDHIELRLEEAASALMEPKAFAQTLAAQLQVEESCIRILSEDL